MRLAPQARNPAFWAAELSSPVAVDIANNFAVEMMSPDDNKRNYWKDMLLASMLVATGIVISALSLAEIRSSDPQHLAQATQPLQSTPGAESRPSVPAESDDDRHPAVQHSARARAPGCGGTKGGRPARAAACAGGEGRAADQGSVVAEDQ